MNEFEQGEMLRALQRIERDGERQEDANKETVKKVADLASDIRVLKMQIGVLGAVLGIIGGVIGTVIANVISKAIMK